MPSRTQSDIPRGWIIPIGGKLLDPAILDRFVELSGGSSACIAIIPTASSEAEMGEYYELTFARHGVRNAKSLRFERRTDCDDADWLAWLEGATGVFLTGGNQLKLSSIIGGTPVARLLRARNAAGVPIAGTSAGAAFLSEHMIAYGDTGEVPHAGMVTMCAGLGLTNRVIVDQHFNARQRLGRLLTALAYNPFALGLGVDEDTAAFISPDDVIDVVGSGSITLVDPSNVRSSDIADARPGEELHLEGVKIDVLARGAVYDLGAHLART